MPPALSPSRAGDFKQCPLLYRFRTIDKIETPPSPAASRGTLVHAVLERLFDHPAAERTPAKAVSLIPGEWQRMLQEEPQLATLLEEPEVTEESWLAAAEALVHRWFTLENPQRLEPTEREYYVETEIDGLTLRGYVDRLDIAADGAMRVVDYKTGRAPSEVFEGKALFQMKFYALVLSKLHGQLPRMLQLVYLGDGQIVRYVPDEADIRALERNVKAVWTAIERAAQTGDWRPKKSALCSWCDFQQFCPEFGGTPPPLPPDASLRALDPSRSAGTDTDDDEV